MGLAAVESFYPDFHIPKQMFNPNDLLINDPHFRVSIDLKGTSSDLLGAVWNHQHGCVAENDFDLDEVPTGAWNAIERELGFGHWDVLAGASISVNFIGFPHAAAMQWRTHKDSEMLCQSMRWTGKRFQKPLDEIDLDKAFYRKPKEDHSDSLLWHSIATYQDLIKHGHKEEDARNYLASGYRQDFHIHGTIQAWWHVLDRRLLADAQTEARCAAAMALIQMQPLWPEAFDWYIKNRAGKNKLSP
jgi:thymidylate synthase ThyX